ncbi:DUF2232 domain-containing protein [Geminicoccaceae bacterium 1502E]|nr:DUF2232 domain-containing protein [Geminicoccaceae bacterium 1502E]
MGRAAAFTALAGLASATLFLSLVFGATGAPALFYFVQLPLLITGLGLGFQAAAAAAAGAGLLITLLGDVVLLGVFVAVEAVPVLLLVRAALLWRAREDGGREWFPAGAMLGRLVLYVLLAGGAALLWLDSRSGGLGQLFGELASELASHAGDPALGARLASALAGAAVWLPGVAALSLAAMALLNALVAQLVMVRAGRALRPSPDIVAFEAPSWCLPGAVVGALALLLGGEPLAHLGGLALLLCGLPFLFQGLAVIHALVRRRASGRAPLVMVYLLLVLFSWPLLPGVALLGLVESWAGLRRRFA